MAKAKGNPKPTGAPMSSYFKKAPGGTALNNVVNIMLCYSALFLSANRGDRFTQFPTPTENTEEVDNQSADSKSNKRKRGTSWFYPYHPR